ncbi:hypothetical protein BCBD1442_00180 [Brucella ceti]|nr:hypothetical protein BCBD1442_00180 [Brucella ceti]
MKIGKQHCFFQFVRFIQKPGNGIGKLDIILRRAGRLHVLGRFLKLQAKVKEGLVMRFEAVDICGVKFG